MRIVRGKTSQPRVPSAILLRSALFSTVIFLPFGRCAACLCVHIVNTLSPAISAYLSRLTVTNLFQLLWNLVHFSSCRSLRQFPNFLFILHSLATPCLMHNVSLSIAFVPAKNGISHWATSSNCKQRSSGFSPSLSIIANKMDSPSRLETFLCAGSNLRQ